MLAGLIFAEIAVDGALAADVRALAARNSVTEAQLHQATRFAGDHHTTWPDSNPTMRAMMVLVRAVSPSPAEIDEDVVAACREGGLSAPAIVELVSWIAVLRMLHRLTSYYATT